MADVPPVEPGPSALLADLQEIKLHLAVLTSGVRVTAKFFRDTATFLIGMGLAFWILGVTIVVDQTITLRGTIPLFVSTAAIWMAALVRLSLANRIERMLARNRDDAERVKALEAGMIDFLLGWRTAWAAAANYRGARAVMVLSKLSLLSWMIVAGSIIVEMIMLQP